VKIANFQNRGREFFWEKIFEKKNTISQKKTWKLEKFFHGFFFQKNPPKCPFSKTPKNSDFENKRWEIFDFIRFYYNHE